MKWLLAVMMVAWWAVPALAQDSCDQGTCIAKDDLNSFLQLARDHGCRVRTEPKVTMDGLTIVTDRMGRVYGSGTGMRPLTLKIDWCNYQLEATTNLQYQVAERVESDWGFRLRLKAAVGILPSEALRADTRFRESLDGGVMIEPFYYHWANINGYVGLRSVGLALGFDLTRNASLYVGYGLTWGTWRSTPLVGVGFALW